MRKAQARTLFGTVLPPPRNLPHNPHGLRPLQPEAARVRRGERSMDLGIPAFAAPAIAILIFAVILIFTMVKSVPQGEHWTVERFGRYTHTLEPGLRFLVPLMD